MPNIEDFTAGNIAIRPQEIGVESTAAAGRRLGVYGSQIAESYTQAGRALGQVATAAEQYLTQRDINTGAKHAADLRVAKEQSWSDFVTGRDIPQDAPNRQDLIDQRINNPNVGKQWRDQSLEPDLQQFEQSFLTPGGREWATKWTNEYRMHMAEKTAADQSSMAGHVQQANIEKMRDSLSVSVFNDPSPHNLKSVIEQFDHGLTGSVQNHPTLKPEEAARITGEIGQQGKQQLVQSAVQGAIMKGGNYKAIASDPAYAPYIKPAENAMFERQARTQDRANFAYSKQAEAYQRSIDRDNVEAQRNKIWSDNFVSIDPETNKPIFKPDFATQAAMIPLRNPTASNATETAHALLSIAENSVKPGKATTDPAISAGLTGRMFDPNNPTSTLDILKAEAAGKVTHPDGTILREMVTARDEGPLKDPVIKAAIQAVKDRFMYSSVNPADDPLGSTDYAKFLQIFMKDYAGASTKPGGVPANALDSRDPNSLISKSITAAHASLQDQLRTPTTAKFTPPADWLTNGRGEYSDPDGNVYDKDGKPTGRKITVPKRWPTVPISQ